AWSTRHLTPNRNVTKRTNAVTNRNTEYKRLNLCEKRSRATARMKVL
ncbi:hypothetical protein KPH14_012878, partial [Odynerus spinipes]